MRPELSCVDFCFSPALFHSPFFQLLCKIVGHPQPADKVNFKRLMKSGKNLALIPGGFEEATITSGAAERVYLKDRRGFVKYALENGFALTPIYTFGENKTYSNVQGAWGIRFWLNSLGLPGILPFGKWWCPILPRNEHLHIVVGPKIQLPKVESPSESEVAKHHARYISELVGLFERHKYKFGFKPENKLEVW